MNPQTIKHLVILGLCMAVAVLMGTILASGSWEFLILLLYALLGIYVLAAPGFIPLLAIGLTSPFNLPIPIVSGFPFIVLILGICTVKAFLYKALSNKKQERYQHCFTWMVSLFFAWVCVRYCMNPVMPNVLGFGSSVTGFRAYLNYGVCFALMVMMPLFFTKREDFVQLIRWLSGIALFFIVLMVPLMLTKSSEVALWLIRFGLFVTYFDNGWLRFVVLPGFGLTLLCLVLLPNILRMDWRVRGILLMLSLGAIVLGGNRSSLVIALLLLLTVSLVRYRFQVFAMITGMVLMGLVTLHIIGENVDVRSNLGLLRILSLTSQRVAQHTDAAATAEWRWVLWSRTWDLIKQRPYLGSGYGGLENAWVFGDSSDYQEGAMDIAIASGGVHNGFLASAYALGIPATVLFILIWGSQIWRTGKAARRYRYSDPVRSELYAFVCANLVGYGAWVFIGTDINGAMIWVNLGLGIWLQGLDAHEALYGKANAAAPAEEPDLVPAMSTV